MIGSDVIGSDWIRLDQIRSDQIGLDGHLQGSGLLEGRVALQPGSVESRCCFLQPVQGVLDLCVEAVTRPDETVTKVTNGVDALGAGFDLRLHQEQRLVHREER